MASNYFPTPNPPQPGVAGSPFGLRLTNAPGSNYATNYSLATTDLLRQVINYTLFDSAPAMYNPLKLLAKFPLIEKDSDEYKYMEIPWQRPTLTVGTWTDGTATMTLAGTYAAASDLPVCVGDVIANASDVPFMVQTVTWNGGAGLSAITLSKQTGGTLGAADFAVGEVASIQGPLVSDGMNYFQHYDKLGTITRYNYIQLMQRNSRWGNVELLKMKNTGTTDYIDKDKNNKINQLRTDMMVFAFNGTRGQFSWPGLTSGTWYAKSTMGFYPAMVAAGCAHASPTLSSLVASFKQLAYYTNFKAEGNTRFLFGTDEILGDLADAFKFDKTRYAPNDMIAKLGLDEYNLGVMKFVPVPCDLFRAPEAFGTQWKKRILCMDLSNARLTKLRGKDQIEMGQTGDINSGLTNTYVDWFVAANMGTEYNNPLGGFYMDVV